MATSHHAPLHVHGGKEHSSPRHHTPQIPDFRFEYSYLKSIRPLVHVKRTGSRAEDEKDRGDTLTEQRLQQREQVSIQWARLIWITTRDQVLSPFLQGAAWGVVLFYLKPLMSVLGNDIRLWWWRGSRPRRSVEGEGASWLRTKLSHIIAPSASLAVAK